jgi:hypothetical protein
LARAGPRPATDDDDNAVRVPACLGDLGLGQHGDLHPTMSATMSANFASSVIRIDCAAGSCSAWLSRSAAIHCGSFFASAITRISDGPATMSIPTTP